jgi:ADP-heptose:LPS heptosyltransferase
MTAAVTLAPRCIVLIRRDNIGDLVLTTPLIHALRERFPRTRLIVLGTRYNVPVLDGHPDIDAVYSYDKAKHRPDLPRLLVWIATLRTLLALRRERADLAILAGSGGQPQAARLARWIRPGAVLGFVEDGRPAGLDMPVPWGDGAHLHAAEDVFRLGGPLGIHGTPGPCVLKADTTQAHRFASAHAAAGYGRRAVAVHVSARRPRQRWPADRFAALIRALAARGGLLPVLLWAPGPEEDPRHPGDDGKAATIRAMVGDEPMLAWPTRSLAELSGALAGCCLMICADGGAMHVAAGLGVPIVALFGDSPPARWSPWGVPSRVLRGEGGDVNSLRMESVLEAADLLLRAPRPSTGA